MTKEQKEAARKAAARQAQQATQSVTPPAPVSPPAKGTTENPWTGEDAPENKAARAGQWLKLQNNTLFQFGNEGQGPKGNWRGTSNGDGSGSAIKGAARLASLAQGAAVAIRLNGESETDFAARQTAVTLGNIMARAVAPHITVRLAAVAGGKVKRALSLLEKIDKMPMVPREMLETIEMHAEIEIPAQEAGEVSLSSLSPLATLAEGEESRVMSLLAKSPGSAFRASA